MKGTKDLSFHLIVGRYSFVKGWMRNSCIPNNKLALEGLIIRSTYKKQQQQDKCKTDVRRFQKTATYEN